MTQTDRLVRTRSAADRATVVVGGGIAGLTAALRCAQAAEREGLPIRLTVLEGADRFGGRLMTSRDPYVIESGAEGFVANKPWAMALVRELGLESELTWMSYAGPVSQLYRAGRLYPLPFGVAHLALLDPQQLVTDGLLAPPAAARLAAETEVPPRQDNADESVRDFFVRRFGEEPFDEVIGPLLRGIAGEADELSVLSMMPELRELEAAHGSVTRGVRALKAQAEALGKPFDVRVPLASPLPGMQTMAERLVDRLRQRPGIELRTESPVRNLRREHGSWVVVTDTDRLEAGAVIVAVPAPAAAPLLQDVDRALAELLAGFEYRPAATVSLVFRSSDVHVAMPGTGYVKHHREPGPVSACTWDSKRWPGRAGDDIDQLRVFFRETAVIEHSDDELITLARNDLAQVLGIDAEPVLAHCGRVAPFGLARYPLGYPERRARVFDRVAALPGLYLAGGYEGAGVTDAIGEGEAAAAAVAAYWGRWPAPERVF